MSKRKNVKISPCKTPELYINNIIDMDFKVFHNNMINISINKLNGIFTDMHTYLVL